MTLKAIRGFLRKPYIKWSGGWNITLSENSSK